MSQFGQKRTRCVLWKRPFEMTDPDVQYHSTHLVFLPGDHTLPWPRVSADVDGSELEGKYQLQHQQCNNPQEQFIAFVQIGGVSYAVLGTGST